jgi:hypothetical protein
MERAGAARLSGAPTTGGSLVEPSDEISPRDET